jgi:hypothetical protein
MSTPKDCVAQKARIKAAMELARIQMEEVERCCEYTDIFPFFLFYYL